jgi:hypothetical protein
MCALVRLNVGILSGPDDTSPVLPMYWSTCLPHTFYCFNYPGMKGSNVIHRFFVNITLQILAQEGMYE